MLSRICGRLKSLCAGLGACAVLLLDGCSLLQDTAGSALLGPFSVPPEYVILPNVPQEGTRRDQLMLMKLAELIDTKARSSAEQAEVLYAIGVIYDRLGLEATALSMFTNAIERKVDYSSPYNFLGIYLASAGEYQDAIDTFGQALELNIKDYYVNFNRGIALYYAGRYNSAVEDLLVFHEHVPEDPYVMLWLYVVESRQQDTGYARNRLEHRYSQVSETKRREEWGFNLVRMYLGRLSEKEFFAGTAKYRYSPVDLVEHLCEGYFYLGMYNELIGRDKLAYDYFSLAVAMHRNGFLEHRYGQLEIRLLERKYGLRRNAYNDDFREQGIDSQLLPPAESGEDSGESGGTDGPQPSDGDNPGAAGGSV